MRSRRVTRTSVIGTGVIAVAVALYFWVTAVSSYRIATALRDHGVVTTASVVDVSGVGHDRHVRVAFRTQDGRQVAADVYDFRADPEPVKDEMMPVRYAATDPADALQDARQNPDFVMVWVEAILGLAILVYGALLVRGFWPRIGERWP